MTNTPESFNFDVRIRERMLKKKLITPATVESHMAALKDAEPNIVPLELEQPALVKPVVVVAVPVQPVQPVRSSVADLPPPPPGLIKESPTPPYTPMVIEALPREIPVNGASFAATASVDDDIDEDEDEMGVEAVPVPTLVVAAPKATEPQAVESQPVAPQPPTSQPTASQVPASGNAAPDSEIDDEWGG